MLNTGDVKDFNVKKQFKYIRPLGSGGTGDTHLFEDITTNIPFAIKKYVPKDTRYIDELYSRFVDEIKILFNISHNNIVRIFNYYLYPSYKCGYLQMEYIDGVPIDEFEPKAWGKAWEDIFKEVISAFEYLEKKNILHRDIRAANILIDKDENVKIIDFGFGKKLKNEESYGKSVLLNWPVTELPEEVQLDGIYNHQTEIYFVGKLFQCLLKDSFEEFKFTHIIDKMVKISLNDRYKSFDEVSMAISEGVLGEIDFTYAEKEIYKKFADALDGHIYCYYGSYKSISDFDEVISKLANFIRKSSLEEYIQDNSKLINCFVSGPYRYNARKDVEVKSIVDFYKFLIGLNENKQKIVIDNIYTRLEKINVENELDDIPF